MFNRMKIGRDDVYDKYKNLIGKLLQTPSGNVLGVISKVKVSKKNGKIKSIVYRTNTGEEREVEVNDENLIIQDGVVILVTAEPSTEQNALSLVTTIRTSVNSLRERIRKLDEMYMKLIQLLLDGKIDNATFTEVKSRIDSEKERIQKTCEEIVKTIDSHIRDVEERFENIKRRQGELYAKKVLSTLTLEEELELSRLERALEDIRKIRQELLSLRVEVVTECGRL